MASAFAAIVVAAAPMALVMVGLDAAQAVTSYSLMSSSFVPPDQVNVSALELGVELTTSSNQWVTQVKFYKGAASTQSLSNCLCKG